LALPSFKDIVMLGKFRLATLVVVSAGLCYAMGGENETTEGLLWLIAGGFLITGASNGFNQVWERNLDRLMDRTKNRPIAAGRMSPEAGIFISSLMGIAGFLILYFKLNALSGWLGLAAMLMYVLVYTPLKQYTPIAVFIGAIPGAMPPLLGWAAATGTVGKEGLMLFTLQFVWQFPHFWAIAWMLDDDYRKAGFRLLPSSGGRDKASAFQVLIYTLGLIPLSFTPILLNFAGAAATVFLLAIGGIFTLQALTLYRKCEMKDARALMFGSFFYLPLAQIILLIDRIIS
jgi:protoheme IX farnesyltransferase